MKYNEIFTNIESTVKNLSDNSEKLDSFKEFENIKRSDDEIFKILIHVIFYSGFKAVRVNKYLEVIDKYLADYQKVSDYTEKDLSQIINDKNMLRNEPKIKACFKNAKVFKEIIKMHGSFQNYLNSFETNEAFENLILLKEELEYKFEYLGKVTVYHFLTDIGFPVLKPDRVITRIFERLGLIENRKQLLKTIIQGKIFSKKLNLPIRYIDIIFVTYGQMGEENKIGVKEGICLEKNPKCNLCKINSFCKYYETTVPNFA